MTNNALTDLQTQVQNNPAHFLRLPVSHTNPHFFTSLPNALASCQKATIWTRGATAFNSRRMDSGVLSFIKEIPGSLLCGGRCFYGRSKGWYRWTLCRDALGDVAVKPLLRSNLPMIAIRKSILVFNTFY
ncbi:hypothetical protein CDAR_101011 [Caerostris darwini]|uniref:Uncharacterized protein n=1 Tax=Caerostris darwini TaxID=1538125 RepID=A0AAV4N9F8_9ARAC|nr:hypothetical protein CDAR_101011 [Caerostris darwini]